MMAILQNGVIYLVPFLVIITVIVTIHELGHFLTARAFEHHRRMLSLNRLVGLGQRALGQRAPGDNGRAAARFQQCRQQTKAGDYVRSAHGFLQRRASNR